MKTESHSVLVGLVNWNGGASVADCVERLRSLTYPGLRIVVVDNGSTDGSSQALAERFPDLAILQNQANLGFTGGYNRALRYFLDGDATTFLMLNYDVSFGDDLIAQLVAHASSDSGIGGVSPVIVSNADRDAVQFAGQSIDLGSLGRNRVFTAVGAANEELSAGHVPALWGTAMLVTRAAIEAVGLLDERYFAYWEDVDFSIRLHRAGFLLRVAGGAVVAHEPYQSGTTVNRKPYWHYYMLRNSYILWRTHGPAWRRWHFFRDFLIDAIQSAAAMEACGATERVGACVAAVRDVIARRDGKWDEQRLNPAWLTYLVTRRGYALELLLRGRLLRLFRHALSRSLGAGGRYFGRE